MAHNPGAKGWQHPPSDVGCRGDGVAVDHQYPAGRPILCDASRSRPNVLDCSLLDSLAESSDGGSANAARCLPGIVGCHGGACDSVKCLRLGPSAGIMAAGEFGVHVGFVSYAVG